jgi:hypothetical protein
MKKSKRTYLQISLILSLGAVLLFCGRAVDATAQEHPAKAAPGVGHKGDKDKGEKDRVPSADKPTPGKDHKGDKTEKDKTSSAADPMPGLGPKARKEEKNKIAELKALAAKGDEDHGALSVYDKNAMEHAKALYRHAKLNTQINKEVTNEHADEIGRSIDAAKRHQAVLEKIVPEDTKLDAKLKARHEALKARYAKATEFLSALKAEGAKQEPDAKVIKEHAAAIYHEIKRAEAEHRPLRVLRKIGEATEPPAKTAK